MENWDRWDQFSPEVRAALGAVVIEWARFENYLVLVFSQLIGHHETAAWVIYYNMSGFSARKDLITRLLDHGHKDAAYTPKLIALLGDAANLATLRNDYVHGHWVPLKNSYLVGQFRPRRSADKSTYKQEPTATSLIELASKITEILERLRIIYRELDVAFPDKDF